MRRRLLFLRLFAFVVVVVVVFVVVVVVVLCSTTSRTRTEEEMHHHLRLDSLRYPRPSTTRTYPAADKIDQPASRNVKYRVNHVRIRRTNEQRRDWHAVYRVGETVRQKWAFRDRRVHRRREVRAAAARCATHTRLVHLHFSRTSFCTWTHLVIPNSFLPPFARSDRCYSFLFFTLHHVVK